MTHMDTPTSRSLNGIKASPQVLAFDIFGTVVDWHGSIVREMQTLYPSVDGNAFALAWRAGY
jgi:2-haloacid dehalogenase